MSISPINILQRLLELKLQQQKAQTPVEHLKTENSGNTTTGSDYQTIVGLSAFDSTLQTSETCRKQLNWDQQTITSPTKTFGELLEEKLALEPAPMHSQIAKTKKPFLKRGTGLARFRLTSKAQKRPSRSRNREITPLKAPELRIQAPTCAPTEKASTPDFGTPKTSEQTLYERALEKELEIFEALEDKANNSSFCSTNSSVLRILASTPSRSARQQAPIAEERRVRWESDGEEDEIESELEKKDVNALLDRLKLYNEGRRNLGEVYGEDRRNLGEVCGEDRRKLSESTDCSTISGEFEQKQKADACVGTAAAKCQGCELYEAQVAALELSVRDCRRKMAEKSEELEERLIEKRIQLEKEFKVKVGELHAEKENFEAEVEAERKKLMKEKAANQGLLREAQSKANRREREELTKLKQELAEVRETLKLKENKSGMTQARLRNQIKHLEKEAASLKDDIAKLTKENARLGVSQKMARRSETKILKELNQNVAKLSETKCEERDASKERLNEVKLQAETKQTSKSRISDGGEDSLLEMTKFRNCEFVDVEKQYKNVFCGEIKQNSPLNDSKLRRSDRIEQILADGSREMRYNNGNVKTTSSDGNTTTMKYFNGDIKQTNLIEGQIKYFYFDKNIWQTTFNDGNELIEFPDGSKEKRFIDGKTEIILPDSVKQTVYADGNQEINYTDGSILKIAPSGERVLLLPNGQKEIETSEHKRREYPDGTIKILYPDGTQETRYSNGRIRIRNSEGKLVMDTHS